MGWRENYQQASFRGAIFYVDSIDGQYGRRSVTHEYPDRDKPFTEDLGRKAREFSVTAYLVGANYQPLRDALIAACETAGPGQLVHPYKGRMTVCCKGLTVRESRKDGGYCELSLTFIEDGANTFPSAVLNLVAATSKAAALVISAARGDFLSNFSFPKTPAFVREQLAAVTGLILDPLNSVINASNEFADDWTALQNDINDLMQQPELLADRMISAIRRVTDGNKGLGSSELYHQLSNRSGITPVKITTSTRQIQSDCQNALIALTERVALACNCELAAGYAFDSYQSAETERGRLLLEIDDIADASPDSVYNELVILRTQIAKALPAPGLPEIQTVEVRTTVPAIVLAYRLYADATKAADIVSRNNIRHPGFVNGGTQIEVLSRV
jgi:prophage DNA circulation protein